MSVVRAILVGFFVLCLATIQSVAMLTTTQLHGFNALEEVASTPFVLTYQTRDTDTANAASYSFTSLAIGTAAADRIVIAGVTCSSATAGAVRTVSTLTIGGIGGTARAAALGTDRQSAAIWTADVPTGTTATVAVTWSGQCGRGAVSVWTMTGGNAVPADTLTDGNASADPTGTIDVPANGGAVAVGHVGSSTTTTWTGLTERDDGNIEAVSTHSAASDSFVAAQTGLTVTANFAANADNAMAVVSFGP